MSGISWLLLMKKIEADKTYYNYSYQPSWSVCLTYGWLYLLLISRYGLLAGSLCY
jgi:hypothetical protein